MYILRCTAKLLKELRCLPVSDEIADDARAEVWFANLLRLDRRKCALFTNKDTLYSIFVPGLKREDFLNFKAIFTEGLRVSLAAERIELKQKQTSFSECKDILIAKTNSKSVLGSMNDLALQIEYHIKDHGGLSYIDLQRLNRDLNRVPMATIGYHYSIERMKEKLETPSISGELHLFEEMKVVAADSEKLRLPF